MTKNSLFRISCHITYGNSVPCVLNEPALHVAVSVLNEKQIEPGRHIC